MTDFESPAGKRHQSESPIPISNSSLTVDMDVHVEVCLQFFSRLLLLKSVQVVSGSSLQNGVSHNLTIIYEGKTYRF